MRIDLAESFLSLTRKNVMDALFCEGNPISVEVERITHWYVNKFEVHVLQTGVAPQYIALGVPRCSIEEVAMELATIKIRERLDRERIDSLMSSPQRV